MKTICHLGLAVLFLAASATGVAAGPVKLTLRDGLVTLDARDAPIRQILAEWARVGQTRFLNADRVAGGNVTLQMTDVPERKALEILLRSTAGFIAAPRPVLVADASVFDRIVVMPTARPAPSSTSSSTGNASGSQSSWNSRERMVVQPQPVVDDEEDEAQPRPRINRNEAAAPATASRPGMSTAPIKAPEPPAPQSTGQLPYGLPYSSTNTTGFQITMPGNGGPPVVVTIPQLGTPAPVAQPAGPATRPGVTTPPPQPIKNPGGEPQG